LRKKRLGIVFAGIFQLAKEMFSAFAKEGSVKIVNFIPNIRKSVNSPTI
jgi:hypothetical protein